MKKRTLVPAISFACLALMAAAAHGEEAFFENKVLPILRNRCFECHSHDKKIKGGLALDSRSGWEEGGDNGPALQPGDTEKSLLLKAVRYKDADFEMPPKEKLPAQEIAILEQWVQMGAPDPRVANTAKKGKGIDIAEGRKFWAFQPVTNPNPPEVKDKNWALDPVDAFILSKLESESLSPSPDADRFTWLRRITLDLTGLPPTPAEVNAFAKDNSPNACEKVADRLLNSHAFGERWSRHWLDLTGYADMIGTSNGVFAEHAWRYRDYVIRAFNSDKPFDRFIQEQIAGDLLPHQSIQEQRDNIIATGFLLVGDVEIVNPDKLRMETDHIDSQIIKVGATFMGMTMGCVRCHDHKFDPIGLEDYYGIAGMLRSTASTHKIPYGVWSTLNTTELPETPQEMEERSWSEEAHAIKITALKAKQTALNEEKKALTDALAKPGADKETLTKKSDGIAAKIKDVAREIEHAEFFKPAAPKAFAVHDQAQAADMPVYVRGNPYAPGNVVKRIAPRVASFDDSLQIPEGQSGRLQLAQWLSDKRNPLTARVTVNRIWQKLFGEGLVRSVDYFGVRGETPSHPELLDHIASRFMNNGWSQKQLIRSLVLSRAYRMSSANEARGLQRDPDNRLIWRMNRQRLDAEAIRDSILAVSGVLLTTKGGPSLPLEYVENTGSLQPKGVNPPSFAPTKLRPSQEFERTIYLPVMRNGFKGPDRVRGFFDSINPAEIAGQRPQTVVPTQALFLLNNELLSKSAGSLAKMLTENFPNQSARLEELWLRAFGRPITVVEHEETLQFLKTLDPIVAGRPTPEWLKWKELCHGLLASNSFLYRL